MRPAGVDDQVGFCGLRAIDKGQAGLRSRHHPERRADPVQHHLADGLYYQPGPDRARVSNWSNTVTPCPACASSAAAASPQIPAPAILICIPLPRPVQPL